ncbi:MAG: guanylate kinase [Candidatus Magasanikbacteria bacterium]|nr:guanylate kinase [Candidatus Magasanikbacteria bacterium]
MSGLFVIISSPSGGGKDTVIRELIKKIPRSAKLVTTTTRSPRPEDTEGVTYYFINKTDFENKIKNGEMMEYATYAENYYGVQKSELENKLQNFDVVFSNVDVQGRRNYTQSGVKNLSIFLIPDNLEDLKKRILSRGGVNEAELALRLEIAKHEIEAAGEYEYKVVNQAGHLSETIHNVAKIITSYQENS